MPIYRSWVLALTVLSGCGGMLQFDESTDSAMSGPSFDQQPKLDDSQKRLELTPGLSLAKAVSVSMDSGLVAFTNSSGELFYANDLSRGNWTKLPGSLDKISVSGFGMVGLTKKGEIYFARDIRTQNWRKIPGNLVQASLSGRSLAGVNKSGDIWYRSDIEFSEWKKIPGKLVQASLSGRSLAGVNQSGAIWYRSDVEFSEWKKIPGVLQQLSLYGKSAAGINEKGKIYHTSDITTSSWQMKQGVLRQLSLGRGGSAVGVSDSGELFYNQDIRGESWQKVAQLISKPSPSPENPNPIPSPELPPIALQLKDEINKARAAKGLANLQINDKLMCGAKIHAEDVGNAKICSHAGTDGSGPGDRLARCQFNGGWGEIIACGQTTPAAAVKAWNDSPGHAQIMYQPGARYIGLYMVNNYWVAILTSTP